MQRDLWHVTFAKIKTLIMLLWEVPTHVDVLGPHLNMKMCRSLGHVLGV
jgi:hypothetical protein